MKVIGITGKAGSGKTTLANFIQKQEEGIEVIHLDHILDDFKKKYLKKTQRIEEKNNDQEEIIAVKSNLKRKLMEIPFFK